MGNVGIRNSRLMANFECYRMRLQYKGLEGLSGSGFKKKKTSLDDLFPTADKIVLSMEGYFQKLGESASIIYEVPGIRFDVVDNGRVLELAMANPKGDYVAVMIDVLSLDVQEARMMMGDIEEACGIVWAKLSEVMRIMEMPEEDYLQRARESMRLLADKLRR